MGHFKLTAGVNSQLHHTTLITIRSSICQERIQIFPKGAPNPKGDPTYHLANMPETCMKMKKIGLTGGGGGGSAHPKFYYVDPPLFAALFTTTTHHYCLKKESTILMNAKLFYILFKFCTFVGLLVMSFL